MSLSLYNKGRSVSYFSTTEITATHKAHLPDVEKRKQVCIIYTRLFDIVNKEPIIIIIIIMMRNVVHNLNLFFICVS